MTHKFDLIVIGAGPGGYVCAIKAAQLGLKVACVEKRETFGGTCLNVGCIPSKALLNSSHKYHDAKTSFHTHGIDVTKISLNLKQMMTHKETVVGDLTKGIAFLFKKNNVTAFKGTATIPSPGSVHLDSGEILTAPAIVIATGSVSATIPGITIDEKTILSSTGALSLTSVPSSMVIVGGGYIGLELGSVWSRLGTAVTVVEFAPGIVPAMDREIATELQRILEKQGLKFKLGHKVETVETTKEGLSLTLKSVATDQLETLSSETLLVSVGRHPCTDGLGLDALGIQRTSRGQIEVTDTFETTVPGIYAIGDVISGPMLAHKAEEEGVALAEHLAGKPIIINHDLIPGVIYTHPEVATVGSTEEALKESGTPYNVGKFSFKANARAHSMGDDSGFVKILSHKTTDAVLGVHIIGGTAGNLIAEAVAVMTYGGSAEDIGRICHAHPTESEALKEAALMASGLKAIHA